jgi:DNA-binding protein HU-beta
VNKAELIDALAGDANLPKADAMRAEEALFGDRGIIVKTLKSGDKVQITGFGTFQAKQRAARTGRNPATGGTITIPAQTTPAFKAGQGLKDALNP